MLDSHPARRRGPPRLREQLHAIAPCFLRTMLKRILGELGSSFIVCLGERVLERAVFPGLHLMPGRMIASDPARADSMSALIAEAIALMAMIWLFIGTLYIIGWLYRRPLRWQVPPIITFLIAALIFAGSFSQWLTMPPPPAPL
jgi:hypothetical protein